MQKIKRVSSFFRAFFFAIFIIYPVLLTVFWIHAPTPIAIGPHALGIYLNFIPDVVTSYDWYSTLHSLLPLHKFLGFLISFIPLIITELTLYFLIKLFGLYKKAEIFSLQNVIYIRRVGYTLLIGQLLNPFYQALMTLNLSWNLHPKYMAMSLSDTNIGIFLTALLVILISWIMAEGCRLREEQQLTI